MSPMLVFDVPAAVAIVLTLATGLAWWHTRRPYLGWWALVWLVTVGYYLAFISAALVGAPQADVYARLGVLATAFGWLRAVGCWGGARLLAGRPVGPRAWAVVAALSALWLWAIAGPLAGRPEVAGLTRMSYACWFLLGAVVLLRQQPRGIVGLFCGVVLLLMGVQGFVSARLVLDLFGTITSSWLHTALSVALGLGVLGRLLEEEREAARARGAELLAANARLAELDQLKTDFVSLVSHELRTPLGLIKGYTGTLRRPDVELDAATRQEFLAVIEEETDRLTELVTNLLDMSRIEAGTFQVEPRPTDLAPLLAECATRLRAREPDRALVVGVPPCLPPVLADERRIRQVVDNLLSNAARYTPADTPIVLRAQATDGAVTVVVVDHGPGIPADKREQVFERFVRLAPGDAARPGGTGLGLAICRGIIEAHHGRIWVEDGPAGGACFAFSLAAREEAA